MEIYITKCFINMFVNCFLLFIFDVYLFHLFLTSIAYLWLCENKEDSKNNHVIQVGPSERCLLYKCLCIFYTFKRACPMRLDYLLILNIKIVFNFKYSNICYVNNSLFFKIPCIQLFIILFSFFMQQKY